VSGKSGAAQIAAAGVPRASRWQVSSMLAFRPFASAALATDASGCSHWATSRVFNQMGRRSRARASSVDCVHETSLVDTILHIPALRLKMGRGDAYHHRAHPADPLALFDAACPFAVSPITVLKGQTAT
jgi:hypothetical protein